MYLPTIVRRSSQTLNRNFALERKCGLQVVVILWCRIRKKRPYKERLIRLDLLPLVYDRELRDMTFFYKCSYGQIDLK